MKAWPILTVTALAVVVLIALALREDELTAPVALPPEAQQPVESVVRNEPVSQALPDVIIETPEEPAGTPDTGAPQVINDTDLMNILRDHGFGKLETEWREWAIARGYPSVDASGVPLYNQPYEQYDDETLRGLAGNGDMWAAQILAKRIALTNPADAIELYRQAAVAGSVYAMNEMASLLGRIADKRREVDFKSDELALEQVFAMRDAPVTPEVASYAWTAVAEMAGTEPMFGTIASAHVSRKLTEEQKEEACALARGMYDDLRNQRQERGLGDFERGPPPLVFSDPTMQPTCGETSSPGIDLSGCREVTVEAQGQTNSVWICGDEGS